MKDKRRTFFNSDSKFTGYNFMIYLINEYANFGITHKKESSVEKLGEDVGARVYESLFFCGNKLVPKNEERKTKILDILNYVKTSLWPALFDRAASGLESFIGERKHSVKGTELKEFVVYDIDPIYNLRYTKDNFLFKYFAGLLKGFLTYAGFPCKVLTEVLDEDKAKPKCEFIILFEESVFDSE